MSGVPVDAAIDQTVPPDEDVERAVLETIGKWRLVPPRVFTEVETVWAKHQFDFAFE